MPTQELPSLSAQGSPCAAGGEELGLKEQAPAVVPFMLLCLAGQPRTLLTTEEGWQQCRIQGTSTGWERFPARGRYYIPFGSCGCPVRSFPGAVILGTPPSSAMGGESFTYRDEMGGASGHFIK